MEVQKLRLCPYDSNHAVRPSRFIQHLAKCKIQHPNAKLLQCFFNASHLVKKEDCRNHLAVCPDAMLASRLDYECMANLKLWAKHGRLTPLVKQQEASIENGPALPKQLTSSKLSQVQAWVKKLEEVTFSEFEVGYNTDGQSTSPSEEPVARETSPFSGGCLQQPGGDYAHSAGLVKGYQEYIAPDDTGIDFLDSVSNCNFPRSDRAPFKYGSASSVSFSEEVANIMSPCLDSHAPSEITSSVMASKDVHSSRLLESGSYRPRPDPPYSRLSSNPANFPEHPEAVRSDIDSVVSREAYKTDVHRKLSENVAKLRASRQNGPDPDSATSSAVFYSGRRPRLCDAVSKSVESDVESYDHRLSESLANFRAFREPNLSDTRSVASSVTQNFGHHRRVREAIAKLPERDGSSDAVSVVSSVSQNIGHRRRLRKIVAKMRESGQNAASEVESVAQNGKPSSLSGSLANFRAFREPNPSDTRSVASSVTQNFGHHRRVREAIAKLPERDGSSDAVSVVSSVSQNIGHRRRLRKIVAKMRESGQNAASEVESVAQNGNPSSLSESLANFRAFREPDPSDTCSVASSVTHITDQCHGPKQTVGKLHSSEQNGASDAESVGSTVSQNFGHHRRVRQAIAKLRESENGASDAESVASNVSQNIGHRRGIRSTIAQLQNGESYSGSVISSAPACENLSCAPENRNLLSHYRDLIGSDVSVDRDGFVEKNNIRILQNLQALDFPVENVENAWQKL